MAILTNVRRAIIQYTKKKYLDLQTSELNSPFWELLVQYPPQHCLLLHLHSPQARRSPLVLVEQLELECQA